MNAQCPFCGFFKSHMEVMEFWVPLPEHSEYYIVCDNCGARGPNAMDRDKANELWEMRREYYPGPQTMVLEDGTEITFEIGEFPRKGLRFIDDRKEQDDGIE